MDDDIFHVVMYQACTLLTLFLGLSRINVILNFLY